MNIGQPTKPIVIDPTHALYKWSRIFNRVQRRIFTDQPNKLRREKQIEDFVLLNGYRKPWLLTDTDVLQALAPIAVHDICEADICVVTDQKFSRYPCPHIIKKIIDLVDQCPVLYLCLNRHYINIDNSFHDQQLDDHFNMAITQWLKKNLPYSVTDLALDYQDYGHAFTWAIPDRHYIIQRGS
jgi:hypothetical protein